MSGNHALDDIGARLQSEDRRLRRWTLRLTLLPILAGVVLVGVAQWKIRQLVALEQQMEVLEQEKTALEQEKMVLEQQKTQLDREIANRRELLDRYLAKLPPEERIEALQLQKGLQLSEAGRSADAIREFQKVITEKGGDEFSYRLQGSAYYANGEYPEAIQVLRQASERDPRDANARYGLGLALWAVGEKQEAVDEAQKAFALDPSLQVRALQDPQFRPILDYRDHTEAGAAARSNTEREQIQQGLLAAKQGEFKTASEYYRQAIASNPSNKLAHNWLGYALFRSKQYPDAIASLQRAIGAGSELRGGLLQPGDRAVAKRSKGGGEGVVPTGHRDRSRLPPARQCGRGLSGASRSPGLVTATAVRLPTKACRLAGALLLAAALASRSAGSAPDRRSGIAAPAPPRRDRRRPWRQQPGSHQCPWRAGTDVQRAALRGAAGGAVRRRVSELLPRGRGQRPYDRPR